VRSRLVVLLKVIGLRSGEAERKFPKLVSLFLSSVEFPLFLHIVKGNARKRKEEEGGRGE